MTVEVWENPPFGNYKILFASGGPLGWSNFEVVAEELTLRPGPQITWTPGPAGPWPAIFFLVSGPDPHNLVYTTRYQPGGWGLPEPVPGDGDVAPSPIAGPFDVVTYGPTNRSVLGLGEQPTCPCGTIHHIGYNTILGWTPAEIMTSNHAEMNWPMSSNVKADPDGRVHAFWYQRGSDFYLEPVTRTLEYWIKDEFGWTEAGQFLDSQEIGPLGERVGLDVSPLGEVVMAWTRRDTIDGEPQPQQVWIARPRDLAAVPETGAKLGGLALEAWPNPFNPAVTLAMEVSAAGAARLEVYDLRGRRVIRLFDDFLAAGRREVAWDGRDAAGRSAPSGVYFARLETAAGRAVQKLVLTE
jgi:hypothetical protein